MSHIWAPPVYRRLLSSDKRERDMSERCLLNTRCTILPPPLNLSKAVVQDLKPRLLTGMHHANQWHEGSNYSSMGMVYPLTGFSCLEEQAVN
ncbi:hypothetical protein FF2_042935 [Malus domestica]